MSPEQQAAQAIALAANARNDCDGQDGFRACEPSLCFCRNVGRDAVERMSAAGLVVLTAERAAAMVEAQDLLRELLGDVLAALEVHLPYAPWHGGMAKDADGKLIVQPGSLIAQARAALSGAQEAER